ncbi:MAG: hypothetical protein ACO3P1_03415 [Pseudomonadales bacterium]
MRQRVVVAAIRTVSAVLALGVAMVVHAAAPETSVPSYAAYSNEALTELTARWDTLNVHERRALLTEVRQRMARSGTASAPTIQIRTERRYGRIIRRADGRLIRIETQLVQVRPAQSMSVVVDRSAESGPGFGTGFEHRSGAPAQYPSAPVMPASSTSADAAIESASSLEPTPASAPR